MSDDKQIIDLYLKRDERAISQSDKKYGDYCFSVANRILDNSEDSKECVNDTWLNAWNAIPPHHPEILRMFFAKITRSLAFNRFKANSAKKRGGEALTAALEELAECIPDSTDVESSVIAAELEEIVKNFVHGLPEREGDIFCRRYFFTESIAEIAKGYGITVNNATVLLSRTRKKLKDCLMKERYL